MVSSRHQTIYARDANGQVMAIYERTFNPASSNDPGAKLKFKIKLEWFVHGCVIEIELEEGVNCTIDRETNIIEITEDIVGSLPPPCSDPFVVPDGTALSLSPPFNEKEAEWGWGGYRQYNQSNGYKDTVPKAITVLVDDVPQSLTVTTVTGSITYTNVSHLPKVAEWHIYGNEQQGRFLTKYPEELTPTYYGTEVTDDIKGNIFKRQLGKKAYELKDHLGNVRTTFSDIKMPTGSSTQPFMVDLLSKSEYYPFGMKIEDLSWNETGVRYGYNGTHEQDLEVNPEGNYLSFGDFGYDTRTARRQNIDPMFAAYPHLSGYATFNNNPITYSDPSGWEPEPEPECVLARDYGGGGGFWSSVGEALSSIGSAIGSALGSAADAIASIGGSSNSSQQKSNWMNDPDNNPIPTPDFHSINTQENNKDNTDYSIPKSKPIDPKSLVQVLDMQGNEINPNIYWDVVNNSSALNIFTVQPSNSFFDISVGLQTPFKRKPVGGEIVIEAKSIITGNKISGLGADFYEVFGIGIYDYQTPEVVISKNTLFKTYYPATEYFIFNNQSVTLTSANFNHTKIHHILKIFVGYGEYIQVRAVYERDDINFSIFQNNSKGFKVDVSTP